uniref:SSD domain-containing protein n=1 Tax=Setaria digitata TaxID=48799 RepID=A0A915PS89_9BILA
MQSKRITNAFTEETILVQLLKRFFRLTGRNVAARPNFIISITLFITALSSFSILLAKMTNDVTDFTPKNARALKELEVYNDFFGSKGDPIVILVLVTAKDGDSMLRVPQLSETVRLLDLIVNDVEIRNEAMNRTLIFSQFCTSFCEMNEPVRNVYHSLAINNEYNESSAQISLAYPVSTILGQKFRIDDNFFGVQVGKHNVLADARLVLLQFRAILQDHVVGTAVQQYEMAVTNFLRKNFTSDLIDVVTISPTFITDEIVRAGLSLLPFTIVGFIIMCTFSSVTTVISSMLVSQFDYYKVLIALAACVSPLLACSTALGLLLWCGLRFGSILTEMAPKLLEGSETEQLSERLCSMLQEVGPSITITTLTNVLAFGVGIFSSIPEIQIFCIGNALAMTVDFIYQITLFTAIMAVMGRHEMRIEKSAHSVMHEKWFLKRQKDLNFLFKSLSKKYCSVLCTTSFSVLTVVCLLIYWSLSIYGALTISIELRPEKLLKRDSDIVKA